MAMLAKASYRLAAAMSMRNRNHQQSMAASISAISNQQ